MVAGESLNGRREDPSAETIYGGGLERGIEWFAVTRWDDRIREGAAPAVMTVRKNAGGSSRSHRAVGQVVSLLYPSVDISLQWSHVVLFHYACSVQRPESILQETWRVLILNSMVDMQGNASLRLFELGPWLEDRTGGL